MQACQKVELKVDAYGGRKFSGVIRQVGGATGSMLSLFPPENATGNAPRQDYFPSKVYWNPGVPRSEAAAKVVAKLFAPADVERIPPLIVPLQRNTMLTVVVGTPFHGTIAPASPTRTMPSHTTRGTP
jgi:hypothetical protein